MKAQRPIGAVVLPRVNEREFRALVAANVRRLATERRLAIDTLADLAGLARGTLWSILAGRHNPTLRTLHRICETLECAPSELFRKP